MPVAPGAQTARCCGRDCCAIRLEEGEEGEEGEQRKPNTDEAFAPVLFLPWAFIICGTVSVTNGSSICHCLSFCLLSRPRPVVEKKKQPVMARFVGLPRVDHGTADLFDKDIV